MVEPVGATLGSIGILFPIYDACDRLFQGYKLTQSFGDDFRLAQVRFYQQYSRLHETSQRKVKDLDRFPDLSNIYIESLETPSVVIETLSAMKVRFEKGHKILQKYDQLEYEQADSLTSSGTTTTVGTPSQEPSPSTAITTPASSTADFTDIKSTLKDGKPPMSRRGKNSVTGPGWFSKMIRSTSAGATASAPTPKIDHVPPWLNSPAVNARREQSDKKAQRMGTTTSFLQKVGWAKEDKEALNEIINLLRSDNEYLEIMFAFKPTHDMGRLVNPPEESSSWLREARTVQGALKRLHQSLRNMNTERETREPWQLSIQLMTDYSDNCDYVVSMLNKLPLRDKAYYFNIQRQNSSQASASFVLAETVAELPCQPKGDLTSLDDHSAWHLDQARSMRDKTEVEGFKPLGIVWINEEDQHWLYHAESQEAHCNRTLATILREEAIQDKVDTQTRILLACLVAISYIHFSLVRSSCREIETSSFRFFESAEDGKEWENNDPLILKPYLCIGFGQNRRIRIGDQSGVSSSKTSYIVGLGVLLYQIGCCVALDYTSGTLREAKVRASKDLHQLDRKVSGRYAELVQSCLQYPVAGIGINAMAADRFIEGVVAGLFKLREELC